MIYPVVILAGGIGSRLGKLTKKTPKALIEVNGKPFIHYQLKLLSKQGIKEVILCIGYLGSKIQRFVGDGKKFNLDVKYSYEKKLLGTGGAVKNAFPLIKKNFFIMYGDTYLSTNFINIQNKYKRLKSNALVTIYKNQNNLDKSNVFFNGKSIIYNKKIPKSKYALAGRLTSGGGRNTKKNKRSKRFKPRKAIKTTRKKRMKNVFLR